MVHVGLPVDALWGRALLPVGDAAGGAKMGLHGASSVTADGSHRRHTGRSAPASPAQTGTLPRPSVQAERRVVYAFGANLVSWNRGKYAACATR